MREIWIGQGTSGYPDVEEYSQSEKEWEELFGPVADGPEAKRPRVEEVLSLDADMSTANAPKEVQ